MGGVQVPLPDQFASSLYQSAVVNSTPQDDIFPDFDSTIAVKTVDIDATANTGEDVYLKFYNNEAPTVGTTVAHMVLWGKAGVITSYVFPADGIDFPTTIFTSIACVKEAGGKEGTTAPSGVVAVKILANGT